MARLLAIAGRELISSDYVEQRQQLAKGSNAVISVVECQRVFISMK